MDCFRTTPTLTPTIRATCSSAQSVGLATNVGQAVAGTYGSVDINADGSFVYVANKGGLPSKIVAQDTFNYTVADGHGGTDVSTLSVIVTNPNVDYLAGANTTLNGGNGKSSAGWLRGTRCADRWQQS